MSERLVVITNMPDTQTAQALAQKIIAARVAACVNQLAPCTSTYRWQETIVTTTEIPLLIKTTQLAYSRLEALIRAEHPYAVPEIIALPIVQGWNEYLTWMSDEVADE